MLECMNIITEVRGWKILSINGCIGRVVNEFLGYIKSFDGELGDDEVGAKALCDCVKDLGYFAEKNECFIMEIFDIENDIEGFSRSKSRGMSTIGRQNSNSSGGDTSGNILENSDVGNDSHAIEKHRHMWGPIISMLKRFAATPQCRVESVIALCFCLMPPSRVDFEMGGEVYGDGDWGAVFKVVQDMIRSGLDINPIIQGMSRRGGSKLFELAVKISEVNLIRNLIEENKLNMLNLYCKCLKGNLEDVVARSSFRLFDHVHDAKSFEGVEEYERVRDQFLR